MVHGTVLLVGQGLIDVLSQKRRGRNMPDMGAGSINARVVYVADGGNHVVHEGDFRTVAEAEDWLFATMKAAYRSNHGLGEVAADWESDGGAGATFQLRII